MTPGNSAGSQAGAYLGDEIEPYSKHPSELRPYALCPPPTKTRPACLAIGAPNPAKLAAHGLPIPALEGSGELGGLSPADLQAAYNLPSTGGEGMTVAVTIPFGYAAAESDLAVYRSHYGLPACTTANGCFKKVNEKGEEGNYPPPSEEWAGEASLDLDMVSATCPKCHIIFVVADYDGMDEMIGTAAKLGADVISNSWLFEENPGEEKNIGSYEAPGIPVLFATGDFGYAVSYFPVASPNVIAVGGTRLEKAENARGWTETAWTRAGGGCSKYMAKPSWQKDSGCPRRTMGDVAAVADPDTPVSTYNSEDFFKWRLVGGTSAATPLMAGIEALASSSFRSLGPRAFSYVGQAGKLYDPVEGETGLCGSYLCQAEVGYDGPTGWGTPNGSLSLPVAVTEGASAASSSKATLSGSVRPGGLETKYRFEYGETTSYGTSVPIPDKSVGSGSEYVEVSQAIEGLTGQKTYHYRIRATNSEGTFFGVDRTFGTTPPAITTGAASEILAHRVSVGGTVNPEGLSTSYWFEYGPTTAYENRIPLRPSGIGAGTTSVEAGAVIESLKGNSTYHYRLAAKSDAGTSYGADKTFTTTPSAWSLRVPQAPSDSTSNELSGVSCPQSSMCIAVGSYRKFTGYGTDVPLARRWDGTKWSVITTPIPSGIEGSGPTEHRFARLTSVSCTGESECMAVGVLNRPGESREPLSMRWNGSEWKEFIVPRPSGATDTELLGVACPASNSCVAVGVFTNSGGTKETLAESWNGSEWKVQATPNPAGNQASSLAGVSCSSSTGCTAVGKWTNTSGVTQPLVERWGGNHLDRTIHSEPRRNYRRRSQRGFLSVPYCMRCCRLLL